MIEYILLFSLGFLAALLIAILVAPVVRRRIVRFTEHRIRATVPISSAELRAQADMARAGYAAENARLSVAVRDERQKGVASLLAADRLRDELRVQASEGAALMERVRSLEDELVTNKDRLAENEALLQERLEMLTAAQNRIMALGNEAEHLGGFIDTGKIDLAVRETEIENLRSSLNAIKGERDKLREDLKKAEERARSAEFRLEENRGKIVRLQDRLDNEIAANASHDERQEPRASELDKLHESLKNFVASTEPTVPERLDESAVVDQDAAISAVREKEEDFVIDQEGLTDDIRASARDVTDALAGPESPENDQAMREEIASIAARMVALTASKEGASSPLLGLVDKRDIVSGRTRLSLAARAARVLSGKDGPTEHV